MIGCRLCRFENAVYADGGLGDGTGAGDAELFFFQLALELFDLRGGGVVLLLQLINDIDQVKTAEMPQLFVRHFFSSFRLNAPDRGALFHEADYGTPCCRKQ